MKYILLILLTISLPFVSFSQAKYVYDNIPDSLKKNADYIVWEDLMEFEIIDKGNAVEKVKYAVCIVDQYSKAFNDIYVGYSKDALVSKLKAEIYDANGRLVKKLKKSDIKDVSAVSGYSLFEDSRALTASFTHNNYPYTLVYEYERKVDGLLHFPSRYFQGFDNAGIMFSKLKVVAPSGFKFRYKEYNLNKKIKIEKNGKKDIYTWEEENLVPREPLELSPPIRHYQPIVHTAPIHFSQGGVEGNMLSWESFGFWRWHLNKGRSTLPEDAIKKVKDLTNSLETEREKIKSLYEFMQNSTRYVSVQEGIGGWQAFPADYVYRNGYGDCKALSNYMYSLLKIVGIKSYYTIIRAGRDVYTMDTSFVRNWTNHIILCVPQKKDTIWLECTSQKQPFNFLGSFTNDRHVLLITEEGGKLVKTPKYGKDVSTQIRNIDLKIDAEGHATAKVHTSFNGLQYENRDWMLDKSEKEQKDAIKEAYGVPGMEINDYKFTEHNDEIPSIEEELDLNIVRFASASGKRMFVKLNVFNQASYVPKNEERKIPFRLSYEYADIDTVKIEIPEGYNIESKPKGIALNTKFGNYSLKFEQNGNKVLLIRNHSSEKGIFSTDDYKAYYEYRKKIKRADKARLVLVKKT